MCWKFRSMLLVALQLKLTSIQNVGHGIFQARHLLGFATSHVLYSANPQIETLRFKMETVRRIRIFQSIK